MQEETLEQIRKRAYELHDAGTTWHFHILTPTCTLNGQDRYAFILEDVAPHLAYVHYSDRIEKELGGELSPLLHGKAIKQASSTTHQPSKTVQAIVTRAKACNEQGIEWHHHVLFPGCIFNTHSPKHTLLFEGADSSEILESVTKDEPGSDLKLIEPLFYRK